ncbi:hypothetical protein Pmani_012873 [Petrolisthes manimaculis]|uniref:Uncharacterized protein n=1 Tax=Petrolisthes manimaculis TaxID=1843537 RepID=A0AAE1PXM2_9EUCA|nr:hypothetical protein Pmani_012873 [Petrolisthes manimaculis]
MEDEKENVEDVERESSVEWSEACVESKGRGVRRREVLHRERVQYTKREFVDTADVRRQSCVERHRETRERRRRGEEEETKERGERRLQGRGSRGGERR